MNRIGALIATGVLLVAGLVAPVGAVTPDGSENVAQFDGAGPTNETVQPGAQLSSVIAVQGAEVESELNGRSFGIAVARANSDSAKASVVADEVDEIERETSQLRERKRALIAARENGSISETRYRVEMATIAARSSAAEGQLNRTAAASRDVPADMLAERGADASKIERLSKDARNLSGQNVADVAGTINGTDPGRSLANASNSSRVPSPTGLQTPPPSIQTPPMTTNRTPAVPPTNVSNEPNATSPNGTPTAATDTSRPTNRSAESTSTNNDLFGGTKPGVGGPPDSTGPVDGQLTAGITDAGPSTGGPPANVTHPGQGRGQGP